MAHQMPPKLRVLITNILLNGRSGTEIVTRNLAFSLNQNGHRPMVYSPQTGEIAQELRSLGIPVLSSIDQIREVPDIIHGHHTIQTATAATRFPQTPAIFVCHDFVAWHDAPPKLPNILKYVAVGDTTHDRLTIENGISSADVEIIENGIDIERFKQGPDLPAFPRNALIFAKHANQVTPILEACAILGITATVAGHAVGNIIQSPETVMPEFDLVFASGLTAIEAMSCLRPVIVCDGRGLAGLVTLKNYRFLRQKNFGLRSLVTPLTTATILREIDQYSAPEATAVGLRVRLEAALPEWTERYISLYQNSILEFATKKKDRDQRNMLNAMHMQKWSSPNTQELEREHLHRLAEVPKMPTLQAGLLALIFDAPVLATASHFLSLSGFHPVENWGVWSAKPFCSVIFKIPDSEKNLAIQVEYMPLLTPGRPVMDITCLIDGEPCLSWSESGDSPQTRTRTFTLPSGLNDSDKLVFLSFKTSHLVSPHSENINSDTRSLGIGLLSLTLLANPTEDAYNRAIANA
jgi:hypothetical protein